MRKIICFISFCVCVNMLWSQQKTVELTWTGSQQIQNSYIDIKVPKAQTDDIYYEDGILQYRSKWRESQLVDKNSLQVINVSYETVVNAELYDLDTKKIPSEIHPILSSAKARNEMYAVFSFYPYVRVDGVVKRVTAITINYTYEQQYTTFNTTDTSVGGSVLATGDWFKFYIEKTGVYRIDRSFLSSLGINMSAVDPRTIKVYGYGGEMLPLVNGENAFYDLPEVPLYIRGEDDGSMDGNDFILFYATAGDQWSDDSQTNLNLYTDITYYFITYGGAYGKRVEMAQQPTAGATTVFTNYDDYLFHEEDNYSVVQVGRRWFGEYFNVEPEQTFSFDLENIDHSEDVRVGVKAIAAAAGDTSMDVSVGATDLFTLNFSGLGSFDNVFATQDDNYGNSGIVDSRGIKYANVSVSGEELQVELSYNNGGDPSALGALDYISVNFKRLLEGRGDQFVFQNNSVASLSGVGEYQLSNASDVRSVWDVTDMYNVSSYDNNEYADNFTFKTFLGESRKYVAVDRTDYYSPSINSAQKTVVNQDLKTSVFQNSQGVAQSVDYIIVAPQVFLSQAERLANIHRDQTGMKVKVVPLQMIYNEFSTGNQDIGAIRNFVKYVYDNAPSDEERLKYLCLFGDTSYDYKDRISGNTNFVPIFNAYDSVTLLFSFASDDFYGMMDENEGLMLRTTWDVRYNEDLLDVAVGRVIVDNVQQATQMVDKIEEYFSEEAFGRWRNNIIQLSDDAGTVGDAALQVALNNVSEDIEEAKPFLNLEKIYLDAYVQQSTAGGQRYPDAKEELLEKIKMGALVMNYFGHGNEEGLASERILQVSDIQGLENQYRYPLFVTITCDFTRFDNPAQNTGGEYMYWNPTGGAIGLIATNREIYVSQGTQYNRIIAEYLYAYDNDDVTVSAAESLRQAKVIINGTQKRLVSFVGDPALRLAFPRPEVHLTHVNDVPVAQAVDTLKALSKVKFEGNVTNAQGGVLTGFNGQVFVTVYDKNIDRTTLDNDNVNQQMDFYTLGEVLFRGKATVENGLFEFNFVVPKDALIPVGKGRVSFYAVNENYETDKRGYNTDILVGDLNENAPEDNQGPQITLYMNDQNFIYGGMTNQSPVFLAYLEDENGINTSSGIGHDIVGILDGDESNPYIMNDYYETELDVYSEGVVTFPFTDLEPGLHTLTFKAWDTYNNSGTAEIQFLVIDDDEMKLEKVLNYPNPFVSYTEFWFQHNKPFEPLDVLVQVFTVSGKLVWSHKQTVVTDGYLSRDITWDGRDDFGNKIGKGVYVYKITVKSTLSNKKAEKFEKLVIL